MRKAKADMVAVSNETEIERIRESITALKEARDRMEDLPVPLDEALARLDKALGSFDRHRPEVGYLFAAERGPTLGEIIGQGDHVDPDRRANVLLWSMADAFKQRLVDETRRYAADMGESIPSAKRRDELKRIDGELLALEREEEALIERSEQTGAGILRRPDADPRAVLNIAA